MRPTGLLSGVLTLGKSVEVNKAPDKPKQTWSNEYIPVTSIAAEEKVLFNQEQEKLTRELNAIRSDIQQLITLAKETITKEVIAATEGSIIAPTKYHVNFLARVRLLLQDLRRNIQEAGEWLSAGKSKKQKKNFWSTYKDRKHGGGEQFLFSNESSATRAVA